MLDAILAWVHFITIFAFTGCLFAEVFFYAKVMPVATLARLAAIDTGYGIFAALVLVSGIAHVVYSPKTPGFYLHDAIFWTKIGLFLAVGLLSIPPTLALIRIRRTAPNAGGLVEVAERSHRLVRACMICEVVLLLFIPLCAALMARGYGYAGS